MRNLFKLLFVILILASGCKRNEVELAFGMTPVERTSELQKKLRKQLVDAKFGWKVLNTTSQKGNYGYYMDFDAEGEDRVRMVSDIIEGSETVIKESAYRVRVISTVSLSFETYNYIHLLADPDKAVLGGESMFGFRGDVEFDFQRSTPDSVFLKGRRFGNQMIMIRATEAEQNGYLNGGYKTSIDKTTSIFGNNLISVFEVNGVTYQINASRSTKMVDVISNANNVLTRNFAPFSYEINGLEIPSGLQTGNTNVKKIVLSGDKLSVVTATGENIDIKGTSTPILPLNELVGFAYKGLSFPFLAKFPGTNTNGQKILDQLGKLVISYPGSYTKCENNLIWNVADKTITYQALLYSGNVTNSSTYRYNFTFDSATGVYTLSNRILVEDGYAKGSASLMRDFLTDNQFTVEYYFANGNTYGKLKSVSGKDKDTQMSFLLY